MEKPSLSLQKALKVVVPMLELYWPLLISALCESMPVPVIVQETGTVILTSSTTLSLVAETTEEERTSPMMVVIPVRASGTILSTDETVVALCVICLFMYEPFFYI